MDPFAALIVTIVGAIVSLLLEIIPGLKDKWSAWKWKPLMLFLGFLLVPAAIFVGKCSLGMDIALPPTVTCTLTGLLYALGYGFLAFMGNQTTFSLVTRKFYNARVRNARQAASGPPLPLRR